MEELKCVITDANIIIDFLKTDIKPLKLAIEHLYEIYIPLTVLKEEILQLTEKQAKEMGLKILESTSFQLAEAVTIADKGPSNKDKLCFILSRDQEAICLTNDKGLRRLCLANGVKHMWGLEMIKDLNHSELLVKKEAEKIANNIALINDRLPDQVVQAFKKKLI